MKFKALFFILSVIALGLWVCCGMVFMQDELSALSRLDFSSLGELLEQGVTPDGHPAFVQVFLYGWTQLFGLSEWAVKLPSWACGLASLWLSYRISKRLFDGHIGLITVALVACSQYFVMYFSLARPYAYGTFFVLGQIYSLIQWRERDSRASQLAFILFAVLSAYTHYFSMLVSGLVSLWAFVWLKKSQYKALLLSMAAAVLLFLPHLPISLHQLGLGGLGGPGGWLEAPQADFPLQFIAYMAQYHLGGLALYALAASITLLRFGRMNAEQKQFIVLGLGVLLIPLVIGYFYSIQVNPVIQFSVLLFGAIPFLIALFAGFKFMGDTMKSGLLLLVIGLSLVGLLDQRAHCELMGQQPYADLAEFAADYPGAMLMADMNESFVGQYNHSREIDYEYTQVAEQPLSELAAIMRGSGPTRVIVGSRLEMLPMAMDLFPDAAEFERKGSFESLSLLMAASGEQAHSAEFSGPALARSEGQEYGQAFEMDLNEIDGFPFITLTATQSIDSVAMTQGTLVSEIYRGDSLIQWLGRDVPMNAVQTEEGLNAYLAIRLQDVIKPQMRSGEYRWKVYYWNRAKEPLQGKEMSLRVFADSPMRYGLFKDF